MDILYYWKSIDSDLRNGRIGHIRSDREKLDGFKAGYPDFIWVFSAPQGGGTDVELVAKLAWKDAAAKGFVPTPGQGAIHYDPEYPRSGRFQRSLSQANLQRTSIWMKRHFPAALKARFVGSNGQHELRGEPLRELQEIAASWQTEPLLQPATAG